jgi:hypothetical protein
MADQIFRRHSQRIRFTFNHQRQVKEIAGAGDITSVPKLLGDDFCCGFNTHPSPFDLPNIKRCGGQIWGRQQSRFACSISPCQSPPGSRWGLPLVGWAFIAISSPCGARRSALVGPPHYVLPHAFGRDTGRYVELCQPVLRQAQRDTTLTDQPANLSQIHRKKGLGTGSKNVEYVRQHPICAFPPGNLVALRDHAQCALAPQSSFTRASRPQDKR